MDRPASLPGDDITEHARSAAPPSPLPPAPTHSTPSRQDTIPGLEAIERWPWAAPSDNDFSPTATAWRAAKALSRTERQKEVNDEFREKFEKISETIDAGTKFIDGVVRLLKWAGGILGATGLVALAGIIARSCAAHYH